ncbi:MAG: hypothetical protein INR70_20580 [Parafilimonas terrae]|nr:hypothetical protein [Parafilimonas terrae]
MLARLARSLRMAGHDTALAGPAEPDAGLVLRCRAENRTLLSRDRALVTSAGHSVAALLLSVDDLDGQARLLSRDFELDWLAAPFTRCLLDNAPLVDASAAQRDALPEAARAGAGPFRSCPACGRTYWPGSHVRRMLARLRAWDCWRLDRTDDCRAGFDRVFRLHGGPVR